MTTAKWTTKSGKEIELITKVIGETSSDHIHTDYTMTVNGQDVKVIAPTTKQGQFCLEFVFVGNMQKYLMPVSGEIKKEIADELQAVKDSVVPSLDFKSDYDKNYREIERKMDGR